MHVFWTSLTVCSGSTLISNICMYRVDFIWQDLSMSLRAYVDSLAFVCQYLDLYCAHVSVCTLKVSLAGVVKAWCSGAKG